MDTQTDEAVPSANPVVEIIAQALYAIESEKWVRNPPKWPALPELRRQTIRDKVQDILLAAMNAGYVLSRIDEKGNRTNA